MIYLIIFFKNRLLTLIIDEAGVWWVELDDIKICLSVLVAKNLSRYTGIIIVLITVVLCTD